MSPCARPSPRRHRMNPRQHRMKMQRATIINSVPEGPETSPFENVVPIRPIGHSVSAQQANAFNQKASGNLSKIISQHVMAASNLDVRRNPSPVGAQASGADMAEPTREEIKAEIAASEARADTKIAMIEGKLDTLLTAINGKFELLDTHIGSLNSSFDSQIGNLRKDVDRARDETKDSRLVLIAVIIGSALALGGLLVALATYGDAMFGRGMNVRDVIHATVQEMQLAKPDAPKTPH